MQQIVFDEPYEFIPPYRGTFWALLFRHLLKGHLRRSNGITESECRGTERLRKSLDAGHGIILAPNHCRPSDPMAMGLLNREMNINLFTMASWHVFKSDWLTAFVIRRLGAFSVYREGMDRQALNCAIEILEQATRPLVIYPEGVITRTNDRLAVLMEGTAFIARTAAKRREKQNPPGKVVIHPVAMRYQFLGDLESTLAPVLSDIETRLSWRPQRHLSLIDRIRKLGTALLTLKEVEYVGQPQTGSIYRRLEGLIDHLLVPLEKEWLNGQGTGDVVARVKNLRIAILSDMVKKEIPEEECERRWRQLEDVYLAQALSLYPRHYVMPNSPPERLLETVERFEEDLTDAARVHGPMRLIIEVGEAIEVSPKRPKGEKLDPVMLELESALRSQLDNLADELARERGTTSRSK
ncbi:MAG: 1-acyl-sn-glycerol-3-phosphate acyltransferase [Planctomycetaceae bacterium]|nr:1-acyl-sn-glycerol-3-phosphate acyltransferase [Planctomycetaceae bacterium]